MTLRNIVDDIRLHAREFLKETGLSPVVRLASSNAVSDVVVFQTRGRREHLVGIAVPKDAGEDAWSRAAIAPRTIRLERIPGTAWLLRTADGVALDDIAGFHSCGTPEECVALVVEHISAVGDAYVPRDDLGQQACTDTRIAEVASKLLDISEGDYDSFSISGDETAAGDTVVNTVSIGFDHDRFIDVRLGEDGIWIGVTSPSYSGERTVSDMPAFHAALGEMEADIFDHRQAARR